MSDNPQDILTAEETAPVTETPATPDNPVDVKQPEGAPEQYEFKFPEGMVSNEEVLSKAVPIFKELNLPQEKAQKLVDLFNEYETSSTQSEKKAYEDLISGWADESKSDPEIGGHNYMEKLAVAKKALSIVPKETSDRLIEMFNFTGVGNHPALLKYLYAIGTLMSEGKIHTGREGREERDPAKILYPNMPN